MVFALLVALPPLRGIYFLKDGVELLMHMSDNMNNTRAVTFIMQGRVIRTLCGSILFMKSTENDERYVRLYGNL